MPNICKSRPKECDKHPCTIIIKGFPGGLVVKNLPDNAGNMGLISQEDSLEKELATDSSVLAWEIPWTAHHVAWWATVHRVTKELDIT